MIFTGFQSRNVIRHLMMAQFMVGMLLILVPHATSQTTPTITALPSATGISFGQALSSSTLTGGSASVSGSFSWENPQWIPPVGTPQIEVVFTPTNTTAYTTAYAFVPVQVSGQGILAIEPGALAVVAGDGSQGQYPPVAGQTANFNALPPAESVAAAPNGNFYFYYNNSAFDNLLWTVNNSTDLLASIQPSLNIEGFSNGIALDASGNIYAGDGQLGYQISTQNGNAIMAPHSFDDPYDFAPDNKGNVFIADDLCDIWTWNLSTNSVSPYVGSENNCGYSGDGGPATQAQVGGTPTIATDSAGNLYIFDDSYFVIRKVTASTGIISTIAGVANSPGYTGDGGPATEAEIGFVTGMTFDPAGFLYLADSTYNVLRKINPATGIISTIESIGGPATAWTENSLSIDGYGNLYSINTNSYTIQEIEAAGAVNLGTVPAGVVSSVPITLVNRGLVTIQFTLAPQVSGSVAIAAGNTCGAAGTSLSPGATCQLFLSLTGKGPLAGSITFTSNANAPTDTVYVSGTGT